MNLDVNQLVDSIIFGSVVITGLIVFYKVITHD